MQSGVPLGRGFVTHPGSEAPTMATVVGHMLYEVYIYIHRRGVAGTKTLLAFLIVTQQCRGPRDRLQDGGPSPRLAPRHETQTQRARLGGELVLDALHDVRLSGPGAAWKRSGHEP